jgi:transposase
LLSAIATILARHGVAPGAYIYVADAALVTEDNLAALGNTLFISRLPATYTACARVIQEAVARDCWEDIGILATTKATKHRPATFDKASEGEVALYGKTYRAVVVHSTAQDKRRLQRWAREVHASGEELQGVVRVEDQQEYFCHAAAEVAAARLRASQPPSHDLVVTVEERPKYGRGRPSQHTPRAVKTMRYGLKCTLKERDATIARKRDEAGCCVLLTNVPTDGGLAHRAGDVLKGDKDQYGSEQNFSFLKDPLMVNSLFLKKPERIEALGLVLWLALRLWRLMERSLRDSVDTTGTPVIGWDKQATERPTTFMMVTKFSGLIVVKVEEQRYRPRALSSVQQPYLTALSVPPTCCTTPTRG